MDPGASRKRSITIVADEPRQKRKVTRACDICKAKKAKCSGTQPCDSCAQKQLTCLYESRYSRGKPPTPLSGSSLRSMSCIDNSTPASPSQITPAPQVLEAPQVQEVPSRASPELEVSGQYADSTSVLSFLHRAWRRLSDNPTGQPVDATMGKVDEHQLLVSAGDKPFQRMAKLQVPPLPRTLELAALYFSVCMATYRMLHRPTVEDWLKTVVENAEHGWPLWHRITRPQGAVALAVLAVASFHEAKIKGSNTSPDDSELSLRQADELFCESVQLVETETGYPKLESAQARLIQVLYLLTSSRVNQAWYAFGHTLLIISALGLHRRKDRRKQNQPRDYIEEQCRKRTFWVAYILDKYLGVVFGRPRHYHDDDIDQDLPDPVNDEDMTSKGPSDVGNDDCHIHSLIHHAKLAQIAERISREVYSIKAIPDHERIASSHRLGAELRVWKASLPPILGAVNPSSLIPSFRRQAIALKISYCHSVMLAHRPFLLKNIKLHSPEVRELAERSIDECLAASQSVLEIVDRMVREGNHFNAFWWTHYVAFCALVVVYVWAIQHSDHNGSVTKSYTNIFDRAERCLNHLAQATATNSPSRRYSIILQELRTEAKKRIDRAMTSVESSRNGRNESFATSNLHSLPNAASGHWEILFGDPIESTGSQIPNFLDDWHTTDWLDLDSSAFGPFPMLTDDPINWMNNTAQPSGMS
ncbi:hypothetical protein N0V90_001083 [Kalmusia sp. IMI 367209]|nr:hypothetical protein N0V90_001083 [Kalmusia sp. IMI 367209]